MSAVPNYIPRYTVEDYAMWEGDWELWNGLAVSMSPSSFGLHQLILVNLAGELRTQIRGQECHAVVLAEIDWIVSPETVVRPDVIVLCGDVPEKHVESPPALVAEILSASTADRDRTFKRELYESQGVDVYLIVDPDNPSMIAYLRDNAGKWVEQSVVDEVEFKLCGNCSVTLRLANLFQWCRAVCVCPSCEPREPIGAFASC